MNADSTLNRARSVPILVWDVPVRVFHWLLAFSFAGAYLSAESDTLLPLHVTLGATAVGLACWRILWGFAGSRHARFASFVRGPRAVASYLGSLLRGRPQHFTGHNPAGALAILAMLGLTLAVGLAGLATYTGGAEWLEDLHEALANLMLAVVVLHIAAVVLSSRLHHEHLVRAMVTGRKTGDAAEGVRGHRVLGAVLLAAVLAGWGWQYTHPDSGIVGVGVAQEREAGDDHGHED